MSLWKHGTACTTHWFLPLIVNFVNEVCDFEQHCGLIAKGEFGIHYEFLNKPYMKIVMPKMMNQSQHGSTFGRVVQFYIPVIVDVKM